MDAEPCFFEAVIVPHRSLSRRGLWLLGAWPIAVFNGVEVSAAALLLRYNARAVRANEVILISPSALRIIRTGQDGGRTELSLPPGWLQVVLEERKGRVPGLFLLAQRERVEVGASLGETEKLSLAEALRAALDGWRHPVFENAQLQ